MHLQGKELVSAATQRAARQLVATALTVFLAKLYELDLDGLQLFGVAINPATVAGAAFIVVAFQLATFLVHWGGDYASLVPWNSAERLNGLQVFEGGFNPVDRIGQIEERIARIEASIENTSEKLGADKADRLLASYKDLRVHIESLRRSAVNYGRYRFLYFYVLYLILPVGLALAALLWPSPNA